MPKNKANEPITDQEITFARLLLSGTMTDRDAAQVAGLPPSTAAYAKTRPRVRAYIAEHRAAFQPLIDKQPPEPLREEDNGREQVLALLWRLANLDPQCTRAGQVKALAMIAAIKGLIPERGKAAHAKDPSVAAPVPRFYQAAWRRDPEQPPLQADSLPAHAQTDEPTPLAPPLPPTSPVEHIPPASANPSTIPSPARPTTSWVPDAVFDSAPATKSSFTKSNNPFTRRY